MPKLAALAKVIRSKNAGPFEITFDIIFANRADYDAVRASGVITPELIGRIYGVATQQILTFVWFDVANAIKFTLPRPRPQGSIGETDMHGAQQHAPLMEIVVP
jgi:hypothetical protein